MGDLVPQPPERGTVAQSPALYRHCPALENDCPLVECHATCQLVEAGWGVKNSPKIPSENPLTNDFDSGKMGASNKGVTAMTATAKKTAAAASIEHVWVDGPNHKRQCSQCQMLATGHQVMELIGRGDRCPAGPKAEPKPAPRKPRSARQSTVAVPPKPRKAQRGPTATQRKAAEAHAMAQAYFASEQGKADAAARPSYQSTSDRPATAKQIAYIKALLVKEGTDNMSIKGVPQDLTTLTSREASALIDDIKGN